LEGQLAVSDLGQNAIEFLSRERPVERLGDLAVVLFEGGDAFRSTKLLGVSALRCKIEK
jgi:hypothetical protein